MTSHPLVLILAPGRDGELTLRVLTQAGHACRLCNGDDDLMASLSPDTGALLLAEEALNDALAARLHALIEAQPAWSDLPLLLVAQSNTFRGRLLALPSLGNVSVLTRPMAVDALTSAVTAALRARQRQFEVRDLLQQQLEEARRKDHFLAMLAHELRNPLAPIRYAAHLLHLPDAPPGKVAELGALIERQVGHMGRIIDQLLDVSRVTRGLIRLQRATLDLARLAREALASHAVAAAARQVGIKGHIEGPVWIDGDETRLKQVLDNLADNAVKFSPAGAEVIVETRMEGGNGIVRVIDVGDGIDPQMLPFLFEPFMQADRSLDRARGGLGLGLALVKGLVELHGGSVQVHSDGPGRGSTFTVSLPLAKAPVEQRASNDSQPQSSARLRVLVAEDNLDTAQALRMVLEGCGYEVRVAHTGPAAVEAARRFRPHAVVCDIGLPGMSGYEVAKVLRADSSNPDVMIAVTGYGTADDRSTALSAGFDAHLRKPVAAADLLFELRKLVAEPRKRAAT